MSLFNRADTADPNDGDGAEANVVPMVLELEEEPKEKPDDVQASRIAL